MTLKQYRGIRVLVATAGVLLLAVPCMATVYLTKDEAFKLILPKSKKIAEEKTVLSEKEKEAIEKKLHGRIKDKSFTFYIGHTDDKVDGYAIIHEEIGKEMPITFIIGIKPDGKISEVAVMAFRESRGDEVRHKRFLRQFEGKDSGDSIAMNRDIKNITGATLSCRAAALAVRKVLAAWEVLYGQE